MRSFTDNAGREWHIEITIQDVRRLRREVGVDLVEAVTSGLEASRAD